MRVGGERGFSAAFSFVIDKQFLAPICQASAFENMRSNFKADNSSEVRFTQL
jgi:hypothetical protein